MTNLLTKRPYYKPFAYPWAYEIRDAHNKAHWTLEEALLHEDVTDWNTNTTKAEKDLLTQIFRFFTTGDMVVADKYVNNYMPIFSGNPEVSMMLNSFADREGEHMAAYSNLLDTIGMPEAEYQAFTEYDEMKAKYDYLESYGDFHHMYNRELSLAEKRQVAKSLAVFSAFTEGMMLFSSFAILLNFSRFGRYKGMCKIVTWSIKDETMHVDGMIKLFRTFIQENPELWTDYFKGELYRISRDMVDLEDKFIDLVFSQGGTKGLNAKEMKQYIRCTSDVRLQQLGLKPNHEDPEWSHYGSKTHKLEWLDDMIGMKEHANFFESRSTEYTKGSITGDWEKDVWANVEMKEAV